MCEYATTSGTGDSAHIIHGRFMEYAARPQSRIGIKQFTMQGNGHEASLAPVHDLINCDIIWWHEDVHIMEYENCADMM